MRSRSRTLGSATAAGALVVLAGCQGLNRDPNPGPNVKLDTLQPTVDFYARYNKPVEDSPASLEGMRRDNWQEQTFLVPITGIEHYPTYTDDKPRRTTQQARQRGEYPSQQSVMEGSTGDATNEQALEGVLAPVRAGWDIVWMIPKMFVTPPGRTVSSPREGYARGPQTNTNLNGGLVDGGLGVTLLPLPAQAAPGPWNAPALTPPAPGTPPAPEPSAKPAPESPGAAGVPGGAIGGSDSPKRKQKPKEDTKP